MKESIRIQNSCFYFQPVNQNLLNLPKRFIYRLRLSASRYIFNFNYYYNYYKILQRLLKQYYYLIPSQYLYMEPMGYKGSIWDIMGSIGDIRGPCRFPTWALCRFILGVWQPCFTTSSNFLFHYSFDVRDPPVAEMTHCTFISSASSHPPVVSGLCCGVSPVSGQFVGQFHNDTV